MMPLRWSRLLLPLLAVVIAADVKSPVWLVAAGVLEIAIVVVAIRELRRRGPAEAEPIDGRIARALGAVLPAPLARLASIELVIVGSAARLVTGGWRRPLPAGFTYHRTSALRLFLPALPLLAIGDVVLLELVVLPRAATWVQVLVHVAAVYGLVWIVGVYATMRARPHQLAGGWLTLHYGVLRTVHVPVSQITSIGELPAFADDWKKRAYCKGAIRMDVAGPQVVELGLAEPVRALGLFGEGRARTRVLVAADNAASFTASLRAPG